MLSLSLSVHDAFLSLFSGRRGVMGRFVFRLVPLSVCLNYGIMEVSIAHPRPSYSTQTHTHPLMPLHVFLHQTSFLPLQSFTSVLLYGAGRKVEVCLCSFPSTGLKGSLSVRLYISLLAQSAKGLSAFSLLSRGSFLSYLFATNDQHRCVEQGRWEGRGAGQKARLANGTGVCTCKAPTQFEDLQNRRGGRNKVDLSLHCPHLPSLLSLPFYSTESSEGRTGLVDRKGKERKGALNIPRILMRTTDGGRRRYKQVPSCVLPFKSFSLSLPV
mmetsp:Transcript_14962/g.30227  ORF Transcript_14962/g.30227 Transcript_14962/m.30227 type:complete len:271 (+) Transcript_14962:349-1161(+)